MADDQANPITALLNDVYHGDLAAREKLWKLVYSELHRMARGQLRRRAAGATLRPTELVNEAYLRLVGGTEADWASRRHFFAAAAEAMRRIRIDYARSRGSIKRGGGAVTRPLTLDPPALEPDPTELLALDEALTKLAQSDPDRAEVVKLRYFVGLSVDETAEVLGVSPRTVDNHWRVARTWLHRELSGDRPDRGDCDRE